ncbi:MAG: AP2 domain-containing protein [Acidobacteriota bacterium]
MARPISRYKGISRIDQIDKRTHGWYVRVGFKGNWTAKFFPDERLGGREEALAAAIQFRDEIEKELGKPRTDRVVVTRSPRNRTGVVGIQRRLKSCRTKSGEITYHPVYEVSWSPRPHVICRTTVSIDKHGETEAFKKAFLIRKAKEREFYGSTIGDETP